MVDRVGWPLDLSSVHIFQGTLLLCCVAMVCFAYMTAHVEPDTESSMETSRPDCNWSQKALYSGDLMGCLLLRFKKTRVMRAPDSPPSPPSSRSRRLRRTDRAAPLRAAQRRRPAARLHRGKGPCRRHLRAHLQGWCVHREPPWAPRRARASRTPPTRSRSIRPVRPSMSSACSATSRASAWR